MRSRRRLAAVPVLLLALAACSGDDPFNGAPTIEGRGGTELPGVEENAEVLESAGEATPVVSAQLDAGATETGTAAGAEAGPHLLRVVCSSSDGAPVTIVVTAGESELTSYQGACVPVFQGGSTMTDSDAFEVPGGDVEVKVTAASESVVAVGLVPAK